jgi:tetratricopeptide (TPR) repeat protein
MEVRRGETSRSRPRVSVSQVKKDILNGWKEIAAYVARDRRTVERWEKLRGLPVRRVPGAGRATVYALISELDEWLASSRPDEADGTEERPADESLAGIREAGREYGEETAASQESPAAAEARAAAQKKRALTMMRTASRWEEFASWTLLAGLGVIFALATTDPRWQLIARFEPPGRTGQDSGAKPHPGPGGASAALHEHSQVAGVDDLYLEGVYSLEQRTPESLESAKQDFTSAIAKDANYAPAYAGLADTYALLREYYVMPDDEAFTKAKAAAEHAVALEPRLSDAHATLGFIDFFWAWDRAAAEREFRTALADDPSSAHAHHWYGSMLTHEGKYQEAIEQLNIAQQLEPTSAAITSTRALALGLSGHRNEAVEMLEGLINESPGVSSPHAILAILSRVEPADWGRYLEEMRRAAELRHSDEMLQVAAAAEPAFHDGGERAMWMAILAAEEKLHPGSANRTFLMADADAGLGRIDAGFADLNQVAQRHDANIMGVILDPTLAPLRRDRRFGQLLRSIGLTAQPQ